jgi:hypothetical protein
MTDDLPPRVNYLTFRGRCKELSEAACALDSTLTLVRGHYYCPVWNSREEHWWTARPDGSIYDPSAGQFPSAGLGLYEPFDGFVECANCGAPMREEEVKHTDSRYAFCSYLCHGRFVGVL